jgi:hypothetical protein
MDAPLGLSCVEASLDEPDNLTPRRLSVASLLSFFVNSGKQLQDGNPLSASKWESHHHPQNNPHGH